MENEKDRETRPQSEGERQVVDGRDAVLLLLRFMFAERRYTKCTVGVYAGNAPSLAMHRQLGFVEEGRIRRFRFAAGQHEDLVYLGLTAEEFAARHPGVAGQAGSQ